MEKEDVLFSKPWKGSDVIVVVEENKLHVHSTILCFASSMFEETLASLSEAAKVIEMKNKKYDAIFLFLKNLYPQYEPELEGCSISELDCLMLLCHEYKVEGLEKRILSRSLVLAEDIVAKRQDTINTMKLFQFADKYKINRTINRLAEYLVSKHAYYHEMYGKPCEVLEDTCDLWKIGSHGRVKIMTCMAQKQMSAIKRKLDSRGQNYKYASDIIKMQEYISNCHL